MILQGNIWNDIWHITPGANLRASMPMRSQAEQPPKTYRLMDGVAVIEITGPTNKRGSEFTESTMQLRSLIRQSLNDVQVGAICLVIDSPGGAVSGNKELADDVHAASRIKPTMAYASDMMASAAYAVGSQAEQVFANEAALIGSIGTMMTLHDYSQYFQENGVKAISITSGGMKGAGTIGTEVTQDQIAYYQGIIDHMTAQFVGTVAQGRNVPLTQAAAWADGRVHIAADAATLGLIDGIMPLDQAVSELRTHIRK